METTFTLKGFSLNVRRPSDETEVTCKTEEIVIGFKVDDMKNYAEAIKTVVSAVKEVVTTSGLNIT